MALEIPRGEVSRGEVGGLAGFGTDPAIGRWTVNTFKIVVLSLPIGFGVSGV